MTDPHIERIVELAGRIGDPPPTVRVEPGSHVFDIPSEPEHIWGEAGESLWSRGETMMLYGGTGLGKTTLAQRIGLAAIGIGDNTVLGYPVTPLAADRKVLYIAADRPRQALRSMRRMLEDTPEIRQKLDTQWVWETHRQIRADKPGAFLELCEQSDAGILILDAAKDLAPGPLKEEEPISKFVEAFQNCIANDIDVLTLHHPIKGAKPSTPAAGTDEVYGSSMLANACGSILNIFGVAGTGEAQLAQLKMPAEQIPQLTMIIDYHTGTFERRNYRDLNAYLQKDDWRTVTEVAVFMTGKATPTDADRKKYSRELEKLVTAGQVEKQDTPSGKANLYRWHTGRFDL